MFVRYDIEDDNGETRRERNERMNHPAPEFFLPSEGRHLWDIYTNINAAISRVSDGVYRLIPPSEFKAWFDLTKHVVYPREYAILTAMDVEYCTEMNKELESIRAIEAEERKKKMNGGR